jgi:AcrR family transcriptional regulator
MESKQKLLEEIMFDGATSVIDQFDTVTAQATDVVERISLAAEVLARYNIQRRTQAYVNAYETRSLEEPARSRLLDRRREYQARWASLIEDAIREGRAAQGEPRLMARYITDAGSAISRWYRPDGEWSEDEVVAHFRSSTMRMLACTPPAKPPRKRAKTSTPA